MLGPIFNFWNKTTNTFLLPYDMISPTLFELAAIASLRLIGATIHFDLELDYVKSYNFNDTKPVYSAFIQNNMSAPLTPVFDDEHVAFHSYWLNTMVFLWSKPSNAATTL